MNTQVQTNSMNTKTQNTQVPTNSMNTKTQVPINSMNTKTPNLNNSGYIKIYNPGTSYSKGEWVANQSGPTPRYFRSLIDNNTSQLPINLPINFPSETVGFEWEEYVNNNDYIFTDPTKSGFTEDDLKKIKYWDINSVYLKNTIIKITFIISGTTTTNGITTDNKPIYNIYYYVSNIDNNKVRPEINKSTNEWDLITLRGLYIDINIINIDGEPKSIKGTFYFPKWKEDREYNKGQVVYYNEDDDNNITVKDSLKGSELKDATYFYVAQLFITKIKESTPGNLTYWNTFNNVYPSVMDKFLSALRENSIIIFGSLIILFIGIKVFSNKTKDALGIKADRDTALRTAFVDMFRNSKLWEYFIRSSSAGFGGNEIIKNLSDLTNGFKVNLGSLNKQ